MDEKLGIKTTSNEVNLILLATSSVSKTQYSKATHKLPLVKSKTATEDEMRNVVSTLAEYTTNKGYDVIGELMQHGHVSPKTEMCIVDFLSTTGFFFKSYADAKTQNTQNTLKNEKEGSSMPNQEQGNELVKNLFGTMSHMFDGLIEPFEDDEVAITLQGSIAVKNKQGNYVSYNSQTNRVTNSHKLILPGSSKLVMAYPVQVLTVGDVIKFNGAFYYVRSIATDRVLGINLKTGSTTNLLKEESVLGLNLYTKAFSLFGNGIGGNGVFGGNMGGIMYVINMFAQNSGMLSADILKTLLPTMLCGLMFTGGMSNVQLPFMQAQVPAVTPNISEVEEEKEEEVEVEEVPVQSSEVMEQLVSAMSGITDALQKVNARLDKIEKPEK